jgi:hypothetical protein
VFGCCNQTGAWASGPVVRAGHVVVFEFWIVEGFNYSNNQSTIGFLMNSNC